ncbi:MAG: BMP family ABC transporter substrate-binding protein [Acidimicrobiia bacterium]|nr:MAG: BMP family ABC transporter substrate-binding protein [Acidimicrobiia bacterium]
MRARVLFVVAMLAALMAVPAGAEGVDNVITCHKPGTAAEHTLSVAAKAVAAHVGHGDYIGICESGPTTIGIAYDPLTPEASSLYNDKVHEGAVAARDSFGIVLEETTPLPDANLGDVLEELTDVGDLVIGTFFRYGAPLYAEANENSDTNYLLLDDCLAGQPIPSNLRSVLFATNEGAFLAGAAAALTSQTGKVGFMGALDFPVIEDFAIGFAAGAAHVDLNIEVQVRYLTVFPDFTGFDDPALAYSNALEMYEGGVDVIEHAAGSSGFGLFDAARDFSNSKVTHVWAIGVDVDQYQGVGLDVQPHILTSVLKRYDVATFEAAAAQAGGTFTAGLETYDLARNGLDYAQSGGFLNQHIATLDQIKTDIAAGLIPVPGVDIPCG